MRRVLCCYLGDRVARGRLVAIVKMLPCQLSRSLNLRSLALSNELSRFLLSRYLPFLSHQEKRSHLLA